MKRWSSWSKPPRRGPLAALLLACALVLAACGEAEPETAAAPTATGEAQESPAAQSSEAGSSEEPSVEEIAQYQEADWEQFLIDGAEGEEGPILVYTSSVPENFQPLLDAFTEKYGIEVETFRGDATEVGQRVFEETAAGVETADVIDTTVEILIEMRDAGLLQPYAFAEADSYPEDAIEADGHYVVYRESYRGLGYNTNLLSEDEVPKTFEELLDPRWKGEMSIACSSAGPRWVGGLLISHGEDFVRQLQDQDIRCLDISARALSDMVISGEVPLSPTIVDAHVADSKESGAPIEWIPLEPAVANVANWALPAQSARPYSSMLLINFALSEEGASITAEQGYNVPHEAVESPFEGVEAIYLDLVVDDYTAEYDRWSALVEELFIVGAG